MARDDFDAWEAVRHDARYAHAIRSLVWAQRWRIVIDTWKATSGA